MTLLLVALFGLVLAVTGLILAYGGSELFWWFTVPGGIIGVVVVVLGISQMLQ